MNELPDNLLAADEPAPVMVHNENGASPFLIVADHAGNSMPRALGRLGVPETECERHIAWDIGIGAVCRLVADALDATLVQQNHSRLVIDCNRMPGSQTSIPEISELTPVPGNMGLREGQRASRVREIFQPYHDRIETELDRRRQAGRPAALIAMHSFTPVFKGIARPWHAGVLYNRDPRFAHLLMALLEREDGLVVGDNEPYSVTDASDYTIPVHGERRGLHHIAIEVRLLCFTERKDACLNNPVVDYLFGLIARSSGQIYNFASSRDRVGRFIILSAVRFCFCRCGHVGNALALSLMSTAVLRSTPAARDRCPAAADAPVVASKRY